MFQWGLSLAKRASELEDRSREDLVQASITEMEWASIREYPPVLVQNHTREIYTRHWTHRTVLWASKIVYLYPSGAWVELKNSPIPWVLTSNGNRRVFSFPRIRKKKTNTIELIKIWTGKRKCHAEDPELHPPLNIIWCKNQHKLGEKATNIYKSIPKYMIQEQRPMKK